MKNAQNAGLTDDQWTLIAPHLPAPKTMGRPRANDRQTLNAILFVLRSGARWKDVPKEFGSGVTAWRRLKQWEVSNFAEVSRSRRLGGRLASDSVISGRAR